MIHYSLKKRTKSLDENGPDSRTKSNEIDMSYLPAFKNILLPVENDPYTRSFDAINEIALSNPRFVELELGDHRERIALPNEANAADILSMLDQLAAPFQDGNLVISSYYLSSDTIVFELDS